jgi:hypothetical protein
MKNVFIFVLLSWSLFISFVMLFAPIRLMSYVSLSKTWKIYLCRFLGMSEGNLTSSSTIRWVRIQGAIGLAASILCLLVWSPTVF